ncbi:MAG: sigma-70 family RNA polymerase sigma factor [Ilumatobacteraceae bacterium]
MRDDLTAASDAGLVLSLARYQQEALGEVYRRHAGAVFGLSKRILGDHAKAEEIVQEVFLRLWNQPDRFDPARGTLRSFLLAQAHSRSVDSLRSDTSRRRREERDAREVADADFDLDRAVWDMAMAEHVRAAMQRLHPTERISVELAYFGGRTYREVAVQLGEPEGTVKSRIRSGLKRLRTELVAAGVNVGDV